MVTIRLVFVSHGRVRLARFTRENYAYRASRLPNREENITVLQSISDAVDLNSTLVSEPK